MQKLGNKSRILIALLSFALIPSFFLPVWRIDLFAPQYPEGLVMKIWLSKLSGDVDIINGLNHYIGMKKISVEMFPEFKILNLLVTAFILYGLVIAFTGSKKILMSYIIVSLLGGILALADFYRWGYDYGHNLSPDAPIKVPGMGYQPPIIGHKQLLNFDAYSMPDLGGWIIIGAVFIIAIIWLVEFRKNKMQRL
jgi:copper chaperone NosL